MPHLQVTEVARCVSLICTGSDDIWPQRGVIMLDLCVFFTVVVTAACMVVVAVECVRCLLVHWVSLHIAPAGYKCQKQLPAFAYTSICSLRGIPGLV